MKGGDGKVLSSCPGLPDFAFSNIPSAARCLLPKGLSCFMKGKGYPFNKVTFSQGVAIISMSITKDFRNQDVFSVDISCLEIGEDYPLSKALSS